MAQAQGCKPAQPSDNQTMQSQAADDQMGQAVGAVINNLGRNTIVRFNVVGGAGEVVVRDGQVTLLGTVVSETDRLAAGEAAREVPRVREVSNLLGIWPEASFKDGRGIVQLQNVQVWPFEAPPPPSMRPDTTAR
jgi:osmotically-inducible protein OsmY